MKAHEARAIVQETRRIHGWFSPEAAMLFAWLDEIQKSDGVVGDVLEIGVHHGKSAVFLGAMLDPASEKLAVCDLFGEQPGNVSGSGAGDRRVFEENWRRFGDESVRLQVFEKSSAELSDAEIGTGHRFVHVDGGHTKVEALHDLRLAARTTLEAGVIVLDDAMTPEWPGVAEAVFHFLSADVRFCAFAAGFNKMVLARREVADRYTRHLDNQAERADYGLDFPWHYKKLRFFDHPLCIFHVPSFIDQDSIRTKLARYYYRHRWLQHALLRPFVSLARLLTRPRE